MAHLLTPRDLRPGNILISLADPAVPVHLAIALALRSPYVHVSLYDHAGLEFSTSIEGFRRQPVADRFLTVLLIDDPVVEQTALEVATTYLGTPYDVLGAFLHLTGQKALQPPHQAKICSEIIGDILVKAGADPRPDIPDGEMLPEHYLGSPILTVAGYLPNLK